MRRVSVFLSVLWTGFWLLAYAADPPPFKVIPFVVAGIVPVALPWGIWWVVAGFRSERES